MEDLVYGFVLEMRRKGKDVDDIYRAISEVYESVVLDELALDKSKIKKLGY